MLSILEKAIRATQNNDTAVAFVSTLALILEKVILGKPVSTAIDEVFQISDKVTSNILDTTRFSHGCL